MTDLIKKTGRLMSTKEVALFFEINEKTVRKYAIELGGIRIGTRYKFYESEVYSAIQKNRDQRRQDSDYLHRTSPTHQQEEGKKIQNEKGCPGVGGHDEKHTRQRLVRNDNHGLFG